MIVAALSRFLLLVRCIDLVAAPQGSMVLARASSKHTELSVRVIVLFITAGLRAINREKLWTGFW